MSSKLPTHAEVVIIGGGIIGCSTAYHLAKMGKKDVLLLERKQLTSGTTWHAAGLVRAMLYSGNLTKLAKYTVELYTTLGERDRAGDRLQAERQHLHRHQSRALGRAAARRLHGPCLRRAGGDDHSQAREGALAADEYR